MSASASEDEASRVWQNRAEGSRSWPGTRRVAQIAKLRPREQPACPRAFRPVLLGLCGLGQVISAIPAPLATAPESQCAPGAPGGTFPSSGKQLPDTVVPGDCGALKPAPGWTRIYHHWGRRTKKNPGREGAETRPQLFLTCQQLPRGRLPGRWGAGTGQGLGLGTHPDSHRELASPTASPEMGLVPWGPGGRARAWRPGECG